MADSRVTRQGVEVLYEMPAAPESRVTRQGIEVLYEMTPVATTDIRITREAIEVLADVDTAPVIQATRVAVEVVTVGGTTPAIQMTRFSAEVLHTTAVIINQGDGTTITRMEGFGTISDDSADLLANGWAAAGGARSIAGGRFGGNGYKLNGLAQVIAEFAGSVATQARWGVTYWAKWTTIGATSNIYHLSDSAVTGTMPSGNTAHANVALNADGSLELFTAGVSRGSTAPGLIVAATYHHIEIRVFIDDVGTAQVWVDGSSVLTATDVDCLLGTTTNVTTNLSGGTSTECIIDDLLLAEGTVVPMNLHQIHELLPTGAGTNSAWTGTFADVDDPLGSPDGDTTVITTQTALAKQDHTFPALPGGITLVHAVELVSRARVNESAPFDIVQFSISGATETDFAAQGLIGTYVLKTDRHNEDPDTATNWTVAGVDALKAGAKPVDS